jgi:hypothetical protein
MDDLIRLTPQDREILREAAEALMEDEPYMAGRLAGLSGRVPDGATDVVERPMAEIIAAEKEFFDKRWYDRSMMMARREVGGEKAKKFRELGAQHRVEIEEKYGKENLGPYTDFEWGELHGKHVALRWVLDPEADWDSEGLGDT